MKSLFKVLSEIIQPSGLEPRIEPEALKPGEEYFTDSVKQQLEQYRDRANTLQDFQGMVTLLNLAIQEMSLHPQNDREKLAKTFNKFRLEKGLPVL